jgi:hypothetical protein
MARKLDLVGVEEIAGRLGHPPGGYRWQQRSWPSGRVASLSSRRSSSALFGAGRCLRLARRRAVGESYRTAQVTAELDYPRSAAADNAATCAFVDLGRPSAVCIGLETNLRSNRE